MNDGFERDDGVRKTLKGPPNNPSGAGGRWLSNQDVLVGLEKEEAELIAMGENDGENLKTD